MSSFNLRATKTSSQKSSTKSSKVSTASWRLNGSIWKKKIVSSTIMGRNGATLDVTTISWRVQSLISRAGTMWWQLRGEPHSRVSSQSTTSLKKMLISSMAIYPHSHTLKCRRSSDSWLWRVKVSRTHHGLRGISSVSLLLNIFETRRRV